MTTQARTRQIVESFVAARSAGDAPRARSYLADDFMFQSPLMRLDDPSAYVAAHMSFLSLVTGVETISELYGAGEATLLVDLQTTTPANTQRTAEHFRLSGNKISSILVIFDASPWRTMLSPGGL